jgi:hypothetical protein
MKVHDLIVPSDARDWSASVIEVASYGMVNFALFSWIPAVAAGRELFARRVLELLFLVVAPAGLAVASRSILKSKLLRKVLLYPSPTAWDYFFQQRRPVWVLAHLKSGRKIGGIMAAGSAASSYPREGDLYVEQLWRVDEDGKFLERIEQSAGALIARSECVYVEFFSPDGQQEVSA